MVSIRVIGSAVMALTATSVVCADNEKEAVQQLQKGLDTPKAVSFWLYNMLAQPYSTDQLLLKGRAPTQLSAVVNSSIYDLGFNATGMRGNEVSP